LKSRTRLHTWRRLAQKEVVEPACVPRQNEPAENVPPKNP
jgi:hypothetical protein